MPARKSATATNKKPAERRAQHRDGAQAGALETITMAGRITRPLSS